MCLEDALPTSVFITTKHPENGHQALNCSQN